jgi:hypothetical protein
VRNRSQRNRLAGLRNPENSKMNQFPRSTPRMKTGCFPGEDDPCNNSEQREHNIEKTNTP